MREKKIQFDCADFLEFATNDAVQKLVALL